MKFWFNIKNSLSLQMMMNKIISDGRISEQELSQLSNFIETKELDVEKLRNIFISSLEKMAKNAQLDDYQVQVLDTIINELNISYGEVPSIAYKIELWRANQMSQGIAPNPMYINVINLQKDEVIYYVINAYQQEYKTVSRSMVGGSAGISIRVAKGVTLRTGRTAGTMVNNKDWVTTNQGTLVVTNKRVVYKNNKRNKTIVLSKIIDIEVGDNYVAIYPENADTLLVYIGEKFYVPQYVEQVFKYLMS